MNSINKLSDWLPIIPLDSWALGLPLMMCWQCVHTILGIHMYTELKFNIFEYFNIY